MDDHPPGGFDRSDLPPNTSLMTGQVFNIPLRCLYSKNVENLLMAGRNISASHVAFTSTRVMGTCATVGQAAGAAAVISARDGITPRRIYQRKEKLGELQRMLLRDDQTIRGMRGEDPQDLARGARVTASAEAADAPAALVINGWTRDIPATKAAPKKTNQWMARVSSDGAWIELSWERPQSIREVQITFDSGFQRELTLSAQDSVNRGMIRAPQPETARDYSLWYRKTAGSGLVRLGEVKENHQRLRRHRFEPVEAQAVRIHIAATNGDDFARIFEVRCYA
jgi:hypothetical protein